MQPVGLTWNHFRRQEALGSGSPFPLFETSLDTGNQHGGDVSSVCPFETSKHETTWCPKMGVPSVLIHFIIGFSLPSSRATPYEWKHPNILKNRRLALKMACFPKHGLVFFRVSSVGSITQKDWSKLHNDLKIGEFNMLQ